MMRTTVIAAIGLLASIATATPQNSAQTTPGAPGTDQVIPEKDRSRPADQPKTQGGGGSDLSEKLNQTDGVLRPPPGIDPEMHRPAPSAGSGSTPVIPPPGSPGNPSTAEPK